MPGSCGKECCAEACVEVEAGREIGSIIEAVGAGAVDAGLEMGITGSWVDGEGAEAIGAAGAGRPWCSSIVAMNGRNSRSG